LFVYIIIKLLLDTPGIFKPLFSLFLKYRLYRGEIGLDVINDDLMIGLYKVRHLNFVLVGQNEIEENVETENDQLFLFSKLSYTPPVSPRGEIR
jgi:hypothetical protein